MSVNEKVLDSGTVLKMIPVKGGKFYLQVADRLVWLNEEAEAFSINTEFLVLNEDYCVAKSTIQIFNIDGKLLKSSQGTKREDKKDFADFMEKAETGSIGRALAMVGFGTQFAPELSEENRLVDAPKTVAQKISVAESEINKVIAKEPIPEVSQYLATEPQKKLLTKRGIKFSSILTKKEASDLIEKSNGNLED